MAAILEKLRNESQRLKKPWFRTPTPETSVRMRLVRSKGTKLESAMEELLRKTKIPYERQPALMGKPDFRIRGTKVVIFCDSSFWHGRRQSDLNGSAFKKNKAFWMDKLVSNRLRDARTNRALRREGWRVLRFWDGDVLKHPEKIKARLVKELEQNG